MFELFKRWIGLASHQEGDMAEGGADMGMNDAGGDAGGAEDSNSTSAPDTGSVDAEGGDNSDSEE